MPNISFYPVGNADSYLITLDNKRILFDYADRYNPDDPECKVINLPEAIREDLQDDELDIVAFTHLDEDHVDRASEFFYFDHAKEYQDAERVKIKELWVPAAAIVEDGADGDARVIRQEARHRLRKGYGIRVFSRPDRLKDWLAAEGLSVEDRKDFITDAGKVVPGLTKDGDGIEFFVHSPFAEREGEGIHDRNEDSLVFQATFLVGDTRFLLAADTPWECMQKIVNITRQHGNDERLRWDVMKASHHCSYLALNNEKGTKETKAVPEIDWLLDDQGNQKGKLVLSCRPVPDTDETQPPHFQARNRYRRTINEKNGHLLVTMEHPTRAKPKRLVIDIGAGGATISRAAVGSVSVTSDRAPRMG